MLRRLTSTATAAVTSRVTSRVSHHPVRSVRSDQFMRHMRAEVQRVPNSSVSNHNQHYLTALIGQHQEINHGQRVWQQSEQHQHQQQPPQHLWPQSIFDPVSRVQSVQPRVEVGQCGSIECRLLEVEPLVLLRALQFVPCRALEKTLTIGNSGDVIVLDLEDSVSLSKKAHERTGMVKMLQTVGNRAADSSGSAAVTTPIFLRVNCLDDEVELKRDLREMLTTPGIIGRIMALILPKVRGAVDIVAYSKLVDEAFISAIGEAMQAVASSTNELESVSASRIVEELYESWSRLGFMPIIETCRSVLECLPIAESSPRNVALVLGHVDLLSESGGTLGKSSAIQFARNAVVKASRACGLLPIDCAFTNFDDHIGFAADCQKAKSLGFAGKACLHPSQLSTLNKVFGPNQRDYHWAQHVLKQAHANPNAGVFLDVDGKTMLGPPFVAKAKVIMEQVQLTQSRHRLVSSKSFPSINLRNSSSQVSNNVSPLPPTMPSYGLNLQDIRVGHRYESLLELTVTSAMCHTWNSSFFNCDRIQTSDVVARSFGLESVQVPYTLLLTLSVAMSVIKFSENATVYLGLKAARQLHPVYPSDTLRNHMSILAVRNTTDGKQSIIHTEHSLTNQRDEVVFTVRKATMFEPIPNLPKDPSSPPPVPEATHDTPLQSLILKHITPTTLARIRPAEDACASMLAGSVIVHRLVKVFGGSEHRSLVTLLRVTNQHHYNFLQFKPSQLLIAGPLSVSAALTNSANDIGGVLHEVIHYTTNFAKVNPGNAVGAVSFIVAKRDVWLVEGRIVYEAPNVTDIAMMEEVDIYTLGIKNVDMQQLAPTSFSSTPAIVLPPQLWYNINEPKTTKQIENICERECPDLHRQIVTQIFRTVLRAKAATTNKES